MKTTVKTFANGLVVKHRRSAIIFERANGIPKGQMRFDFPFTPEELHEFTDYLLQVANEAWKDIKPVQAYSPSSDYDEYYDQKYGNNGYLSITKTGIWVEAPHLSQDTLFQFNKAKIQSFLYDLEKKRYLAETQP